MLFKMLINVLDYSLHTVFPCLLLVLFIHGSIRVVLPIFAGLCCYVVAAVAPPLLLFLLADDDMLMQLLLLIQLLLLPSAES